MKQDKVSLVPKGFRVVSDKEREALFESKGENYANPGSDDDWYIDLTEREELAMLFQLRAKYGNAGRREINAFCNDKEAVKDLIWRCRVADAKARRKRHAEVDAEREKERKERKRVPGFCRKCGMMHPPGFTMEEHLAHVAECKGPPKGVKK